MLPLNQETVQAIIDGVLAEAGEREKGSELIFSREQIKLIVYDASIRQLNASMHELQEFATRVVITEHLQQKLGVSRKTKKEVPARKG